MGIRLGKICRFQSGGTPAKSNPEYFNGTIPWITTVSLNGAKICEDDAVEWITEKAIKESAAKIVPAYSIMVGTRVGVGKVAVNTVPMSTSQDIISLLEIDETKWHKDFLCNFIQGKSAFLNSQARGATIKGIKIDVLSNLTLPDVTIEEQIHISQVIDNVRSIIFDRQQELEKLDELIKARFVEMFGDPLNGTDKWPLHTVGDVALSVDPQPSHRTPPVDEEGIPYVSIKDCDCKTGKIDFDNARKVSRAVLEEHRSRYMIHDGDFIIGKIGTIGNPIFVPARDEYTLSANIVLIQPNRSMVSPYFLKYSFMSAYTERQFEEAKNSTSQAAFGIQKVRQISVMNPDLAEQYKFEKFAKQVDKSKVVVQKALNEAQLLFDSLMQQYFG